MNKKLTLILLTNLVMAGSMVTDVSASAEQPLFLPTTTTSISSSSSSSSVDRLPERKLDILELDQKFEVLCQQLGELMKEFEIIIKDLDSLNILASQSAQQRLRGQVEEGAGAAVSSQAALALSHTAGASIQVPDTFEWDGRQTISKDVRKVTIDGSVSAITPYAFAGCTFLESVIIPEGVITISKYAFADCKSVKEIKIPSTVTSIGDNVFIGCKSLQQITMPAKLQGKISKSKLGVSSECKFVCY